MVADLSAVEHETDKLLLLEGSELLIYPVEVRQSGARRICGDRGGLQITESRLGLEDRALQFVALTTVPG